MQPLNMSDFVFRRLLQVQAKSLAEDDRNLSREKAEAGLGPGPNQRLGKTPNSKSSHALDCAAWHLSC